MRGEERCELREEERCEGGREGGGKRGERKLIYKPCFNITVCSYQHFGYTHVPINCRKMQRRVGVFILILYSVQLEAHELTNDTSEGGGGGVRREGVGGEYGREGVGGGEWGGRRE